jgi:hypothetical protein
LNAITSRAIEAITGTSTWRRVIVTVMTRDTVDFTNAPSGEVLMTRDRSTEEPCAAKGARTVLETSGRGDPLAEFNRALRFAVLWRKMMQGTYDEKGDRWVERILSVRETCRLRGRAAFPVLVEALTCSFNGQQPDTSWI